MINILLMQAFTQIVSGLGLTFTKSQTINGYTNSYTKYTLNGEYIKSEDVFDTFYDLDLVIILSQNQIEVTFSTSYYSHISVTMLGELDTNSKSISWFVDREYGLSDSNEVVDYEIVAKIKSLTNSL